MPIDLKCINILNEIISLNHCCHSCRPWKQQPTFSKVQWISMIEAKASQKNAQKQATFHDWMKWKKNRFHHNSLLDFVVLPTKLCVCFFFNFESWSYAIYYLIVKREYHLLSNFSRFTLPHQFISIEHQHEWFWFL